MSSGEKRPRKVHATRHPDWSPFSLPPPAPARRQKPGPGISESLHAGGRGSQFLKLDISGFSVLGGTGEETRDSMRLTETSSSREDAFKLPVEMA